MAGFEYTAGEMKVLPTAAYLIKIIRGWRFCLGLDRHCTWFRTDLVVIEGNLNAQHYRDEILARHVIPLFQNNANITLFNMIMLQAIQLGTLGISLTRITLHSLMTGLPKALI
jgi:hypothetical protein